MIPHTRSSLMTSGTKLIFITLIPQRLYEEEKKIIRKLNVIILSRCARSDVSDKIAVRR